MMKKALLFAAALLTLAGCKNETVIEDPNLGGGETRSIVFSIGLPAGDPVTYAIHDLDEYRLNTIDVYEFDLTGAPSEEAAKLKKIYKHGSPELALSGTQNATTSSRNLVLTLPKTDQGERLFLFVANAVNGVTTGEDLTVLPNNIRLDNFISKLTASIPANGTSPAHPFLMTGFSGKHNLALGYTANENIMMTRVVARIDLAVNLENASDQMLINSAKLMNVPSVATIFPSGNLRTGQTYLDPSSASINYQPLTSLSFQSDPAYNKGVIKKAFYLYERNQNQYGTGLGTPTLFLDAIYTPQGGSPVKMHYKIEFTNVSVQRNYLYTVILGVEPNPDYGYVGVVKGIKVAQWEEGTALSGEVSLLQVKAASNPTLYDYDEAKHTLTLKSASANSALNNVFEVTSGFKDDTAPVEVVRSNPLFTGSPNNSWITTTVSDKSISLEVGENTTSSERRGIIWIKSEKDTKSAALYPITIVQPGQ